MAFTVSQNSLSLRSYAATKFHFFKKIPDFLPVSLIQPCTFSMTDFNNLCICPIQFNIVEPEYELRFSVHWFLSLQIFIYSKKIQPSKLSKIQFLPISNTGQPPSCKLFLRYMVARAHGTHHAKPQWHYRCHHRNSGLKQKPSLQWFHYKTRLAPIWTHLKSYFANFLHGA